MDEKSIIENEEDLAKRIEVPESEHYKALEMLESPTSGDFISGLKSFVAWAKNLLAKK